MEKQEKKLPPSTISVNIGPNVYEIKFPTTGELIDIEAMKIALSKDTHRSIAFSGTASSDIAYVSISAISSFSVLLPKLKEDLAVKSLLELTPIQLKPLIKQYIKVYSPWFEKWVEVINSDDDE